MTIVVANIKSYILLLLFWSHISNDIWSVVEKLPLATTIVVANIKIDL